MAKRGQAIHRSKLTEPTTRFETRIRAMVKFKTESGKEFKVRWIMVGNQWQIRGMKPEE
jgi:hypothetical protein